MANDFIFRGNKIFIFDKKNGTFSNVITKDEILKLSQKIKEDTNGK